MKTSINIKKIIKTRYKDLVYCVFWNGNTHFIDCQTDAFIGNNYKTIHEIESDIYRFASERGFALSI